uniref:Uncharacterized protein n=1 Tax=Tanacetum cinerariifolium TaxID=118510 RepID=A0A6L2JMY1_TANCI|nr:hypothetical protein [Tanacetum cinerariifolium]
MAASTGVDVRHGGATTTVTSLDVRQSNDNINKTSYMPHDLPLLRVHTIGSDEGRMQHNELMDLVTKLSDIVVALETDLKQTKKVYGAAYTKLIMKGRYDQDMEFNLDFNATKEVFTAKKEVSTAEPVSTAGVAVTTASVDVSPVSPTRRVSTADDITMVETLVYIRRSATKDKGKGILTKSEPIQTKIKLQQEKERLGYKAAVRLQEELDKEEIQRMARVYEAAQSFTEEECENIRARLEADKALTQRLQEEERNKYSKVDQAKILVDLINLRKRYFATQKAKANRNKPMTQAQHRTYMSNYIKHMGSHTLKQLRGYSFDKLKTLFETTMRRVNTFVPIESKVDRAVLEFAAESLKRGAKEEFD